MIKIDYKSRDDARFTKYISIGAVDLMFWQENFHPSVDLTIQDWYDSFTESMKPKELGSEIAEVCHIFSYLIYSYYEFNSGIPYIKEIVGNGMGHVLEKNFSTFKDFVDKWFLDDMVNFKGLNYGDGIETEIIEKGEDKDGNTTYVKFRDGSEICVGNLNYMNEWQQFFIPESDLPKLKKDIQSVINCFRSS